MRKLLFIILMYLMTYCIYSSWDMPANYYKIVTGTVEDRYKSIRSEQQRSYTIYTDELVLMIRYPSGIKRQNVNPNTFYNVKIGDKVSFKVIDRSNWENTWRVLLTFISGVALFLMVVAYKKPEPVIKAKAKFPQYNDFKDDEY